LSISDAITMLREANEQVPRRLRLPTLDEIVTAESDLGLQFHPDYRRFLIEASDVVAGTHEPFILTAPGSHIDMVRSVRNAWEYGVPRKLLPFCEDNGNYFCLEPNGGVVYWDHNGTTDERWTDLGTWIVDVWLGAA
jgi:hypothetical protein